MRDDLAIEPFFHADTGTWSYLVHRGADAVVIDPVLDYDPASGEISTRSAQALLDHVAARQLRVHWVLETHAHADHLTAAAFIRAKTSASVAIGGGIRDVQAQFAGVFGIAPDDASITGAFDRLLGDGESIEAGSLRIEVMATPGHTADGVSYRIGGNVFVGDTVFAPDIGTARCDFPGGSVEQLHASVQRLYALPGETILWLCHDYPPSARGRRPSITVDEARSANRMLRADTPLSQFIVERRARDASLPPPRLLYPALQVNIRGGRLPGCSGGQRFLRLPIHVAAPCDGLLPATDA